MEQLNTRKLSPSAQAALRQRVVRAIIEEDMRPQEAARAFGVGRTSIHRWIQAYQQGGLRALAAQRRGRPPRSRLTGWQAAAVVQMITQRCPDQLKLPFALWTREAVQQLLAKRYEVRVSVWTVGRYLAHWGLTPQKPLRRAYEQNPEAVQRWLDEEYPAIRAQSRREKAEIHWGNEMGMRSDHQADRSYGRRGHTPVIPGTGQRFRCNMISTITNRGTFTFMIFRERFTAPVMLRFLRRLLRQRQRKIFLIVDRHPVHKARNLQIWVAAHQDRLRIFYLPEYGPELNPNELLNQDVKTNAVGRERPATQNDMMERVRSYLWGTQRRPYIVQSYF